MNRPAWVAVALLAASWIGIAESPRPAVAAANGRIDGVVVNGTAGFAVPEGLPVTTHVFRDRAKVGERSASTGPGGRFSLDGLETGADHVYFPVIEYGGASYFPERPIVLDGLVEQTVQIRVFETTTDDSAVKYDRLNLLVLGVDDAAMTLMEMGAILNPSDRTFVGDRSTGGTGQTLRFALPPGALQISPQAGFSPGSIVATPDGFATGDPITPGRHELAFSYRIPLAGPTLELTRRLVYPADQFNIYAPETGISVASPALTFQGTAELGGQRYRLHSASSLPAGAALPIRFSGLPARVQIGPLQLGLAVVGLTSAILAAALLVFARRRGPAPMSACPEGRGIAEGRHATRSSSAALRVLEGGNPSSKGGFAAARALDARHRAMAAAISRLDDRFERGELDADLYRTERARAKGELVDSLLRSGG